MATSDTTRLLVLGAARIFGPANGYQLRRELLSWQVQEWANVNPGSIYSMLATLTKQGLVERSELTLSPGAAPVAVYQTTELGNSELERMVGAGLTTVHQFERTEFYAAASLMVTLFERQPIIAMLEQRIENLRGFNVSLDSAAEKIEADASSPPHVARLVDYESSLNRAEIEWLGSFIDDIRSGEMTFLTEPDMERWKPAADDPAWRMANEREQYIEALKNRS